MTGIEIIIDDSPDAILLSGFDPIRREVARLSLQKLVIDGRIHPARIEEIVTKTRKEVDQEILEVGKRTVIDLGIHNMHHELIKTCWAHEIQVILWAKSISSLQRGS